jgi:hypothetical protein
MSRYARDRENDKAFSQWPAGMLARAIDRGLIEQWPFEVTRRGHRLSTWDKLIAVIMPVSASAPETVVADSTDQGGLDRAAPDAQKETQTP